MACYGKRGDRSGSQRSACAAVREPKTSTRTTAAEKANAMRIRKAMRVAPARPGAKRRGAQRSSEEEERTRLFSTFSLSISMRKYAVSSGLLLNTCAVAPNRPRSNRYFNGDPIARLTAIQS